MSNIILIFAVHYRFYFLFGLQREYYSLAKRATGIFFYVLVVYPLINGLVPVWRC